MTPRRLATAGTSRRWSWSETGPVSREASPLSVGAARATDFPRRGPLAARAPRGEALERRKLAGGERAGGAPRGGRPLAQPALGHHRVVELTEDVLERRGGHRQLARLLAERRRARLGGIAAALRADAHGMQGL